MGNIVRFRVASSKSGRAQEILVYGLEVRQQVGVQDVSGKVVELNTFDCSEFSNPRGEAVKKVDMHLVVVELRAMDVYVVLICDVNLYIDVLFVELLLLELHFEIKLYKL